MYKGDVIAVVVRITIIGYIALLYAFYPHFHLGVNDVASNLYQYLTESFLTGHLHLLVTPSHELLQLPDPYDPLQNAKFRLYDASLFQGKYYLYFGPLPVIVFFIPFKLLTGFYPSTSLVTVVFLLLGLLANFFLLLKIKQRYFPQVSELQLLFIILLLGLTNGAPFLMSRALVYEVAIACAYCFTSFALIFLYNIFEQFKTKDVFLFSTCLASCVATRPHFALVCFIMMPLLLVFLIKKMPKSRYIELTIALLLPGIIIAVLLGLYNYLRFGSILDIGHFWQLSCNNIQTLHKKWTILSTLPRNMLFGFYFNFLQPMKLLPHFPFLNLRWHNCNYHIDTDYCLEGIAGVIITTPFILILLALPKYIKRCFKEKPHLVPLIWFSLFTLLIPLTNAVFLILLPFAIHRYQVDFIPYFIILSIITLWLWGYCSPNSRVFKTGTLFFFISGWVSIFIGFSLFLSYCSFNV